jgi:hypothetical protein
VRFKIVRKIRMQKFCLYAFLAKCVTGIVLQEEILLIWFWLLKFYCMFLFIECFFTKFNVKSQIVYCANVSVL